MPTGPVSTIGQAPFMIRVDDGDIPTTDQYAAMLDAAAAGGYAYPTVNVTSSQTINAAIRCFAGDAPDY